MDCCECVCMRMGIFHFVDCLRLFIFVVANCSHLRKNQTRFEQRTNQKKWTHTSCFLCAFVCRDNGMEMASQQNCASQVNLLSTLQWYYVSADTDSLSLSLFILSFAARMRIIVSTFSTIHSSHINMFN